MTKELFLCHRCRELYGLAFKVVTLQSPTAKRACDGCGKKAFGDLVRVSNGKG